MFCQILFESFGKFAAREHDSSPTAFAFEPNVRAETRNGPLVRATRVLFAEAQMVVQAEIREHSLRIRYEYYKLNCDKLPT